ASSQTTFGLTVSNVPPTASFANTTGSIVAGQSATLAFSGYADVSTLDTAAGYTYSYDCTNHGTIELSGSPSTSFNFAYLTAGTFTALGRIDDKDGGFTDYTAQVNVAAPTNTPTPTPTATDTPTNTPTFTPTNTPTDTPTFTPTFTPTNTPTNTPTFTPIP